MHLPKLPYMLSTPMVAFATFAPMILPLLSILQQLWSSMKPVFTLFTFIHTVYNLVVLWLSFAPELILILFAFWQMALQPNVLLTVSPSISTHAYICSTNDDTWHLLLDPWSTYSDYCGTASQPGPTLASLHLNAVSSHPFCLPWGPHGSLVAYGLEGWMSSKLVQPTILSLLAE